MTFNEFRQRTWWLPLMLMGLVLARNSLVALAWFITGQVTVLILHPLIPNRRPGVLGVTAGLAISAIAVYLDLIGLVSFT